MFKREPVINLATSKTCWDRQKSTEIVKDPKSATEFVDNRKREVQIYMLNNYIRGITKFPKMFFITLTSSVMSTFFCVNLTSDFRIVSLSLIIHMNSKDYGHHPSGGIPLFLTKDIGFSKTQKTLYNQRFLDSTEANILGTSNDRTSGNYRSVSLSIAIVIINSTNVEYFIYTKNLVNHKLLNEFDAYVVVESNMVLH